jgi:hypothetical protein
VRVPRPHAGPSYAMIPAAAFGRGAVLSHRGAFQHYTVRLRRSQRLRYRVARVLVLMLPLVLFLYAIKLAS